MSPNKMFQKFGKSKFSGGRRGNKVAESKSELKSNKGGIDTAPSKTVRNKHKVM